MLLFTVAILFLCAMHSNREILLKNVAQTTHLSLKLEVEIAEGVFIYDVHGKKYMDLNSGISVSSLGHRHPCVIKAIKEQTEKYMHTMVYGEHVQKPQVTFASLLSRKLNNELNNIYFLNSGTEVVEASIKLARKPTGRYKIISARKA